MSGYANPSGQDTAGVIVLRTDRTDAQLAKALRHRWCCTCGHVEIAASPGQLREQARQHHADQHGQEAA